MIKRVLILLFLFPLLLLAQSIPHSTNNNLPINEALSQKQFRKGMIRFNNRQYQASIQIFNQALSLDPLNYPARRYLGYSYLNAGYTRNAMDEWENLIKLGGGSPQLKNTLNDLYFRSSIDKNYTLLQPYIFSHLYDGIRDGKHKIVRPSFLAYNEKNDHLWVSSAQTKYVVEINGNGTVLQEIGRQVGDVSRFKNPMGIALYKDKIYISDYTKDLVYRYTQLGKFDGKFGISGYASSNLSGPMGLTISDDGYLFVVDNGNNRIQKFTLNGEWIQSIGQGKLNCPTDIVSKGKWLFVSDTRNKRVVQFDLFGNFIKEIPNFKEPRGLTLKSNILYIADAKSGVFLYDLSSGKLEALGVDRHRLKYPFDVCLDQKNLLYESDFNSQNIAVYIPLQLKYNNLGVTVSQIWTREYPHNFLHIRVWDKAGQPVNNLNAHNFIVYEEGTFIPKIYVGTTQAFRHRLDLKLILDHTTNTLPYHPEIREIVTALLTPMDRRDWIDTVLVGRTTSSSGKKNANLLQTLNRIFESSNRASVPYHLGETIYNEITALLNVNRNKAVILITSGRIGSSSFEVYDPDVISTYARRNGIPIYVISLSGQNESVFRPLAESTFGAYYTLKDIKRVFNLYNQILNSSPLEYIVGYDGLNLKGLKNFWVNVHLKVKYKGMLGVFDTGYFVPEIILNQKNLINLKKEFGGKR